MPSLVIPDPVNSSGSQRILLVSYHFGPDTETGGFRWTNMVPGLVDQGWQFDVITLKRPVAFGTTGTVTAPPAGPIEVFPVPIPGWGDGLATATETAGDLLASLVRLVSGNGRSTRGRTGTGTGVDPADVQLVRRGARPGIRTTVAQTLVGFADHARQSGWFRAATRLGLDLARRRSYRAVVVSSPPHSTQQVGAEIARLTGLPFIADFRDPWYFGIGPSRENANPVHRRAGRRIEPVVNRRATIVVHNTPEALQAVAADLGDPPVQRLVIPNGYDGTQAPAPPSRDRFIVAFTGVLHPWMDVRVPLAACQRFRARHPDKKDSLAICFMGTDSTFGGVDLVGLAGAYGLADCFETRPRSSREAAFQLQESAAVVVAFDCTHPLCIPTKFYDYARLCGAMLLLGHPDGAMAAAARRIGVDVSSPEDDAAIDAAMEQAFRRWQAGEMVTPTDRNGVFDRRRQTEAWDRLLRSITAPPAEG